MSDPTVRTQSAAGGPDLLRTPEEAAALADLGESPVDATGLGARAATAAAPAARAVFDNPIDSAFTFAEGLVDTLTFGLLHQTGAAADRRRDVNNGDALLGELTGFGLGMAGGPIKLVAGAGKKAGELAAKAVIGDVVAGSRAGLAVQAAGGASEMAGLMAAGSIGHQVTDVLFDDKEFSAAAVVHEAGMGALLGGGFSFLSGLVGRAAKRAEVTGQGGLLDAASAESKGLTDHIGTARSAWDNALETHEARFGVLRALERDGVPELGHVPEFMEQRAAALGRARKAKTDLDALDFDAALNGKPKEWAKWHSAMERYQDEVAQVDRLMDRKMLERMSPQAPGTASAVAGGKGINPTLSSAERGVDQAALELDALMAKDPTRLAAYEQQMGRPYEFMPAQAVDDMAGGMVTPTSELVSRAGSPRSIKAGQATPDEFAGELDLVHGSKDANLKFRTKGAPEHKSYFDNVMGDDVVYLGENRAWTGTKGTADGMRMPHYDNVYQVKAKFDRAYVLTPENIEKFAQRYLPESAPRGPAEGLSDIYHAQTQLPSRLAEAGYDGLIVRGFEKASVRRELAELAQDQVISFKPKNQLNVGGRLRGEAPAEPWAPSSPAGRFNPAEYSANTLAGEGYGARMVSRDLAAMPGGGMQPAADLRQNAEAFAQFRQRAQTGVQGLPDMGTPIPSVGTGPTTKVIARGTPAPVETTKVIPRGKAAEALPAVEEGATHLTGKERLRQSIDQGRKQEGRAAVRRYMDEWSAQSDALGPKHSPGDMAAQEIRRAIDGIKGTAQGREISAATTDIGTFAKLPQAKSALGAELNGIYQMRQVANMAADASKGTVMGGSTRNRIVDWMTRRAAGKAGSAVLGSVLGGAIGGPAGYFAGAALAYKYVGFGGRAAGAAGRLYQKSVAAADTLLKGGRATVGARIALGTRPTANHPVAYSDRGPIEDPVERIQELQRVAQTPATVAERVAQASGDLNVIAPAFVAATAADITAKLTFLLSQAPPIQYDRLGNPQRPSAGAVRRFLEAENAVFNVDSVLDAVASGTVSKTQVQALQQAHGSVYVKMASYLMKDPEQLAKLERAKLRTIEMVVGMPLTAGSDPAFVARQQMNWAPEPMPQQGGPTQALKIPGAGGSPSDKAGTAYGSAPTPSQSYGMSGRAPGN